MPDALVETKLLVPRSRTRTVGRPRLDQLLALGSDATLVLVSAPAGFGKTTLLGEWLTAGGHGSRAAWVSLDVRDRDATSFWTYVLLAVDRAAPGSATASLALLRTGRVPVETVLAALLNELSVLPDDLTLVLDDYHLAEGPDTRATMVFLLDHLPPQVHVVISSRVDPALPLARLRARGQLVEIRAADLRFTAGEASSYLNQVNALELSTDDVAALEARTEGWAAALQLVALSLRGRGDRSQFIAGFAGDDRFVVDYLADEVLDGLPQRVRRFLLDTSVLDRLTGPLCDAVTGSSGGKAVLESLERQNLFVIPLDDQRQWYRYHHLFADVLHAHLLDERPDDLPVLHRRASDWYDGAGDAEAAVRHALAAGDVDLAAARAELAIPVLLRNRHEAVIRRWIDQLPRDVVESRPVLAVGFVGALAASNDFASLDERLRDVDRVLAMPLASQVVADWEAWGRLPAAVSTYRAAVALVAGDLAGTVEHSELALARAEEGDDVTIASASALAGLVAWTRGDLAAAHAAYRVAADRLTRAGHVADVLGCTVTLIDLEMTQGRLRAAERSGRGALEVAARASSPPRGTADIHVCLSRVAWERGDLAGVAEHLRRADELGESAGLPQYPYRWRVSMAHLRAAEGDVATAVALLEEAERVYVADFAPNVKPVAATRARVLAASGNAVGALAWVRDSGVSATDDASYLHEYEHVTVARCLLADHAASGREAALTDATVLLDRLLTAAENGGRAGAVIEVLVLQSLARAARGGSELAPASLEQAVRLAEPEGHVRVFTGEGAPMRALLTTIAERHPDRVFVRRLLDSIGGSTRSADSQVTAPASTETGGDASTSAPADGSRGLVDPLSGRELDVLRHLGSDLDGPAIARALGVSLSTVRTHTQHVYTKLGVTNRRAAVRRAHQLNLFSRSNSR